MKNKILLNLIISLSISSVSIFAQSQNNKIYAVVNGENITQQVIAVALKDPKINFDTLPKDTQKDVLEKIIEQKLLAQNAVKTDVVNDKIYKQTLESLKQDLALQVWMQQESKKINISENELKKFYENNKKLFKVPVQLHARHILVKTREEAVLLIQELNKASNLKPKFIQLAKEKSIGPSGKNGGDLSWFSLDKMVPEFSAAANKLKVGSISKEPVKTQFGFHIIYLEDRKKASTVSFEQAKFNIKQQIGQEKFVEHVQKLATKLKKKAKIEYK